MKYLLIIMAALTMVGCYSNPEIEAPPVDSTIKRIVIQQLDTSFFVLETKNGVVFNRFTTDSLPNYHYVWIYSSLGLPCKTSRMDSLPYHQGFGIVNDLDYYLKNNRIHDTIYRTKTTKFDKVENVHIGDVETLNQY